MHGLATLKIWIGKEAMNRTKFEVPCCIAECNMLLNLVERFNKFSSTNCTMRREKA